MLRARLDLLLEHDRVAQEDGQGVVQLVRHIGEQGPHGGQLLGLVQRVALTLPVVLRGLAGRDVAQARGEQTADAGRHFLDRDLDRNHRAVGAQGLGLDASADHPLLAGHQIAVEAGLMRGTVDVRHDQLVQRPPQDRVAAPAERGDRGRIELDDPALLVDGDDAVVDHLHDRGVEALPVGQRKPVAELRVAGRLGTHRFQPSSGTKL